MNFSDKWELNADGEKFVFLVEMQRALHEAGLPLEPASLAILKKMDDAEAAAEAGASPAAEKPRREPRERRSAPAPQRETEEEQEAASEITIDAGIMQFDPQTGKYIGRMKFYNIRKGYGFILRGEGEALFFHKTNVLGNPDGYEEGQWLIYELRDTQRGEEAYDIEPYEGDPPSWD